MATVSEQLRLARERQQLDIYQVAEITKIKTDHLRALESGDFEVFTAPVYIRGFIRTYATMLKLDPIQLLKELESELGRERLREPAPLTKDKRGSIDFLMLQLSRLNWRTALISIAVLVGLALGVGMVRSRFRQSPDPLKGLTPSVYPSQPSRGGETMPVPAPSPAPAPAPTPTPSSPRR